MEKLSGDELIKLIQSVFPSYPGTERRVQTNKILYSAGRGILKD